LLVLVLAGCGGRTGSTTGAEAADSSTEPCEGAVFEYRDVCFHSFSVEAVGRYPFRYPFDLDGEPGHELIGVRDDQVKVYRFDGQGFVLAHEAETPPGVSEYPGIVAGEFDEIPGLDLIIAEAGKWAAFYHLDEDGAPTLVGQTALAGGSSVAMEQPVAIGPDTSGRWRVVGHYENAQEIPARDALALWEIQGTELVQVERLDLQSDLCNVSDCGNGDFDGDGRTDVVCTISVTCTNVSKDYKDQVVLLAQPDGTVSVAVYPEKWGQYFVTTDLDGDGITDLVDSLWYRMGDGKGGLRPATELELPPPPMLDWDLVSAGDLDGNGDIEVVIGDYTHALVFDDIVGAPQSYEMFEVNDPSLGFSSTRTAAAIDVNADKIADLPMWDSLLVSELRK
jgi:hypothetical protein